MELDVTHLVEEVDCGMLSASQAELGPDAGRITWANSMEEAAARPLLRPDQLDDARQWIADLGAWTRDAIAVWPDEEVQAFIVQYAAGDVRTYEDHYPDYETYRLAAEQGRTSGNLWRADNGRWFFSLSR
jgi:hypothetical protein